MSYVTRSGRRTKKVNYSDSQRSRQTSRSVTPKQTVTRQSDKENESEIEIIENNNVNEPPQKKQKISKNTCKTTVNKPSPQKRRRRRPIRKKKTQIHNVNEEQLDLTSYDNNNNTNKKHTNNKNNNVLSNIPPLIPPSYNKNNNKNNNSNALIIPPLPTCNELKSSTNHNKKIHKRRPRRKKIIPPKKSKQEISDSDLDSYDSSSSSSSWSDSDSESSDELEILPRKKRILPTLKPKKKKPTKKPSKPKKKVVEKRPARKRTLTQKVRDRINRARHQRLFMINATEIDEYSREYAVLGSTGNVYTIRISGINSCTCPDYEKGNQCKHIMFIMLKVLRVNNNSECVYQRGLLKSELNEIFSNAPRTLFGGSVLANESVRKRYQKQTGDEIDNNVVSEVKRKEFDGNECAVCMEEFDGEEATTYCRAQCGNNVHTQCFKEWSGAQKRQGEEVTCMYCRASWIYGNDGKGKGKKKSKGKKKKFNEGYLNLANEQGISRERDTSTYYRSGWNGYGRKKYGYGYGRRYGSGW